MPEPTARKGGNFWRAQVAKAVSVRQSYEKWWEANLRAYAPPVSKSPDEYGANVNTNRDFTLVERKKADLFYQSPEVTLQPSPLMDGPIMDPTTQQPMLDPMGQPVAAAMALQAHQEITNEKLGEDGIDAADLMDAVLFDILNTAGFGCTKMGYESVTVDVEQPDPSWAPDPLGPPDQAPPMVTVPVPIHEHCFWEHVSPKQILIPHGFRSTTYDKAPWLGHQFELPLTEATRAKYQLPEDFQGQGSDAQTHFDHGVETGTESVIRGVELWYRSALYRSDIQHPEHLTQLVLIEGKDEPIEQDSPYQTLTPRGELTPDSLIGFPIHLFRTRTMTDSAYVPSDSTMIRPLVNELNVFREQMVQYRDANLLRYIANADTLPAEALTKIVRSSIGGVVMVPSEAFLGDGAIKPLEGGSMPRESFTSNDYIDNDIARTTAIDASGAGVQSSSSSTATEQQIIAANANARLDKERGVILKQYLKGVTKFSTLLQRYLPVEQAAQIVGPQRAAIWDAWRKTVPSALAFKALPDSALRVDQAVDRKQSQDLYTYLANDPHVNRQELLKGLLRKFHLDPSKIMVQPPPQKPEPPKLALSFKGEDLIGPQAPIVIEILQQQGIQISPEAVSQSQGMLLQAEQMAAAAAAEDEAKKGRAETKHGGKVAQAESLDKHAVDMTGGMQNTGAPAAMGAAGGMLQ